MSTRPLTRRGSHGFRFTKMMGKQAETDIDISTKEAPCEVHSQREVNANVDAKCVSQSGGNFVYVLLCASLQFLAEIYAVV